MSMSKTPRLASHKSVSSNRSSMACSLMLANLLLITIFGPTVMVNCTIYFLPSYAEEEQMLDRYVMPPEELISILVFVLCDIFLALSLLAIRNFTSIYYGCSNKLTPLSISCGSGYIPISLCFKWLLQGGEAFSGLNGSIYRTVLLIVLFVLAIVQLASLLLVEYRLMLAVFRFSNAKRNHSLEDGTATHNASKQHSPTALLFIALKSCVSFWMVIDLFVIQPEALPLFSKWKLSSPMALDYPLILSALNFVFVFFSHQSIEVAYHVGETKCTALTHEHICCEGSLCSSAFHDRKLLAYSSINQLFHPSALQIADFEREVQSEYDLPEWLRLQIFESIYSDSF